MARPASRKAVSSLPAIANIDEQLDEVVMDLSRFIAPVKTDEVEYVIIGGRRDGERGVMDKKIDTINGQGIYHKKIITCGGYVATFFVSSDMGDATPGEVMSVLCHGYRKPK